LLEPEIIQTEYAKLKVLGVFRSTKSKVICGGEVISGKIVPELEVKVVRQSQEIGVGKLVSLQKNKQTAKEVMKGEQCGLEIEIDKSIEVGDELVFFTTTKQARKL
jgi:translation initiation factor IF-2